MKSKWNTLTCATFLPLTNKFVVKEDGLSVANQWPMKLSVGFGRSALMIGAGASLRLAESMHVANGAETVRAGQTNGCLIVSLGNHAKLAHTAMVTGANHGIGAATAVALARRGCGVLCTFLRVDDPDDPGTPQAYRDHRAREGDTLHTRPRPMSYGRPGGPTSEQREFPGGPMAITFPGESAEYRAAPNRPLEQEIELRRACSL